MRANITVAVVVSLFFMYLQSKILGEYTDAQKSAEIADSTIVQSLDTISYSFSQIFGGGPNSTTNNVSDVNSDVNNDAANANNDKPPPSNTWLLNPNPTTSQTPPTDPTDNASTTGAIPKLINKIYFQKGSGFPPLESVSANLTAAHQSWEIMNPGYEVRYWDLERARNYLHRYFHPVFLRAFDCLPAFAAKSDLFRMALLYREGGWHSDWKQVCLRPNILSKINEATDIFAPYDMFSSNDYFPHKCVQNAFVGSKPRHPIIAKTLEFVFANIQKAHYGGSALDATATCIFGRAVRVSEEERKSVWFSKIAGHFVNDPTYGAAVSWNSEPIVKHKCRGCGEFNQDWGDSGNNYIALYKQRNFYCQDAASLFKTTMVW